MEKLFEIQRLIFSEFEKRPFYERDLFKTFSLDNKICGLVGARGVGKTTFLLNYVLKHGAKKRQALYVSADNVYFLENNLIDLVDQLHKETDVRLLCIDEVHKHANWEQELKNITDTYLNFRIIFSGSSQIELVHGKYDLSRRVTLYHLHGLSFREYLNYQWDQKFDVVTVDEIISSHGTLVDEINMPKILKHFHEYLRIGYYPFFNGFSQDHEKFQAVENIVQKIIYEDIGTCHSLKTSTLNVIETLYKFVLNSAPGELNAYKLASNLKKDFESISNYLKYLEQAGLINFIYPNKSGQAYLRNPIKMYPENSNMLYAAYLPIGQDKMMGKVRETFVINQLVNAKVSVYYSEKGDFRINDHYCEVGGKSKTMKQLQGEKNAFVLADGIVVGSKQQVPLYLIGFLY